MFRIQAAPSVTLCLLLASAPAPALAQAGGGAFAPDASADQPAGQTAGQPSAREETPAGDVIVVSGSRGAVQTEVPPVVELNAADIQAAGASSLEDLIQQLSPQIGSGRGRGGFPIFLVNGQRVSGFRELRRYPPEAIEKVEVFPEEVALQYGYPADQRVVNFILKPNFSSREIEVEYGGPTAGGRASGEFEGSLLTINGANRLNVGVEFTTSSLLTEAERGIIQETGGAAVLASDPDPAFYRSLAADTENLEVQTSWSTAFGEGRRAPTLSLNAVHIRDHANSLSGLDAVVLTDGTDSLLRVLDTDPLERRVRTHTTQFGSSFNAPVGDWQLTVTGDGGLTDTLSRIDRRRDVSALQDLVDAGTLAIDDPLPALAAAGVDAARSKVLTADTLATLRGSPLVLPGGELGVTFDTGFGFDRIASRDTRGSGERTVLKRGDLTAGVNFTIPIASAREGFLPALGELSLNAGAGVNRLSDFGTLGDWTLGLTWRPAERLTLQASYTAREAAPTLGQLGDPEIVIDNVPLYDFDRGETVLASILTGGNPDLLAEQQRDWKLSASYDFDLFERSNLLVEYYRNSSTDVTQVFPLLTPAIEAAFPERVTRDGDGRLVAVDRRPVTFAARQSSRIRYGVNLFGRVGREPQGGGAGRPGMTAMPGAAASAAPDFAPGRLAELRARICAPGAGAIDPATLPPAMQESLRLPDGSVDLIRLEEMRQEICSAQGPGFDPQRMAATRQALCAGWNAQDPAASTPPDPAALPDDIRKRLSTPDGALDPARVAQVRARVCSLPEPAAGQQRRERGGEGGGGQRGGGGAGGGFGPMGSDGQGRWNLSLYHTVELSNTARIADGLPLLDLLDGAAIGNNGVPRHKVELQGGIWHKGLGLRVTGNYESATRVDGSGLPGSGTLFFGDLATLDARLFMDIERQKWLVGDTPGFWKGVRMGLQIDNIFDARQRVTDETGVVPLSYQPGLIDPIGRSFEFEIRKVF